MRRRAASARHDRDEVPDWVTTFHRDGRWSGDADPSAAALDVTNGDRSAFAVSFARRLDQRRRWQAAADAWCDENGWSRSLVGAGPNWRQVLQQDPRASTLPR